MASEEHGYTPQSWAEQREWIEICESVLDGSSTRGWLGYDAVEGTVEASVTPDNVREIQQGLYARFGEKYPGFGARIMLGQVATDGTARSFYQAKVGFGDVIKSERGDRVVHFYDLPGEPEVPVEKTTPNTRLDNSLRMREMVSRAIDTVVAPQTAREEWKTVIESDEFKDEARRAAQALERGDVKALAEIAEAHAQEDAAKAAAHAREITVRESTSGL